MYGVEYCIGDWRVTEGLVEYFLEADKEHRLRYPYKSAAVPIPALQETTARELEHQSKNFQEIWILEGTVVLADLREKGVIIFEAKGISSAGLEVAPGSLARVLKTFRATDSSIYAPVSFEFKPVVPSTATVNFDTHVIPIDCCKRVIPNLGDDRLRDKAAEDTFLLKYLREQQQLYYDYTRAFGI